MVKPLENPIDIDSEYNHHNKLPYYYYGPKPSNLEWVPTCAYWRNWSLIISLRNETILMLVSGETTAIIRHLGPKPGIAKSWVQKYRWQSPNNQSNMWTNPINLSISITKLPLKPYPARVGRMNSNGMKKSVGILSHPHWIANKIATLKPLMKAISLTQKLSIKMSKPSRISSIWTYHHSVRSPTT